MKTLVTIILMALSMGVYAQADSTTCTYKKTLSVEIDPAPFILGGYSFSLKYSPKNMEHWSFMASVYSSRFPDKMMSTENYEKGFRDQKMNPSSAVFVDYYLKNNRKGLHFGPSVFWYNKEIGHKEYSETTKFNSIYPNVRLGYLFNLCKSEKFYINPWMNVGHEFIIGNSNKIQGNSYKPSAVSYIIAVHLGYRF